MNIVILIAGLFSLGVVIGHFVFGTSWFLKPMLESNLDDVSKRSMEAVFHYSSAFVLLATIFLLLGGSGKSNIDFNSAYLFIMLAYFSFGLWQLRIAITSNIPGIFTKMFQWIIFISIAILIYCGM